MLNRFFILIYLLSCHYCWSNEPSTEKEVRLQLPGEAYLNQKTISLTYADNSIDEVIKDIAHEFKLNVNIPNELIKYRTSISLNNVTWRQAFEVLLNPIEYNYYDAAGLVRILPKSKLDALPLSQIKHRLIYIEPRVFIDYYSESLLIEKAERFEVDGKTLIIHVHPRQASAWKEKLEWADRAKGLPNYPQKIYWPKKIPKRVLRAIPKKHALGSNIEHTRLIDFEWVDARLTVKQLRPYLSDPDDHIHVNRRTNVIIVTTAKDKLPMILSICEFLDQKKWYLNPEERSNLENHDQSD